MKNNTCGECNYPRKLLYTSKDLDNIKICGYCYTILLCDMCVNNNEKTVFKIE